MEFSDLEEDYYAVLGIDGNASAQDIRTAYLGLAKKLHPDRFPKDSEARSAAAQEFRRVTQAHYILGDTSRKEDYDRMRNLTVRSKDATGTASAKVSSTTTTAVNTGENINNKWADKHLSRANELFTRGQFKEAETAIKEAIRLVPGEARFHNKLAETYLARGWFTYALTEVQASLRINPQDVNVKNLEARIKTSSRDKTSAGPKEAKRSFLDQIKELLQKKS